jgi:hypothetical protein
MSNLKIIKLQYETLNETEKEKFINWINKKKLTETSKEMMRLARILNEQEKDNCEQCDGSRVQYWSDDIYGVCLECCCINCEKLNKNCRCK